MELESLPELPSDARETTRITIRSYLKPDGTQAYHVQATGSDSIPEYLGLLAFAQRDLLNAAPPTP